MDGYYDTLIQNVENLISEEKYKDAYAILEEEFKMPYIPKEYETIMIPLYNTCRSELNATFVNRKYQEEDIETLLFGGIDDACQAVELLKGSNIRKHLEAIDKYLSDKPHFLIRSLLLEALIEQDVKEEMHLSYDGLDITFTPSFVELPMQQDAFLKAIRRVQDYYENDNPSFLIMCIETMMKEMYFKLPFTLEEDEINYFIYAILLYVYKANGDKDGFEAFINEKSLAIYGGYDLLLYTYDIL